MQLTDILSMSGIDPKEVNVILHSPKEREFAKVLPSLFRTRPEAFKAFESTHNTPAENSLKKMRPYVAIFINIGEGEQVFAGIFRNLGWKDRKLGDVWKEPEIVFLHETYGLDYGLGKRDSPDKIKAWFDFQQTDILAKLQGRLLIKAELNQSYVRLCEKLKAPISAILKEGVDAKLPPDWNELTASGRLMRALPWGWENRLREWRGVYLIVDESDGARYVGSAYGKDNLFGRWKAHVAGDKGVTKELSKRDPSNFRFSILQLLAPDAEPDEVIQLESNWMDRLHTREHGLNR